MFSRIKEAKRILKYREPETGADAVIVERRTVKVPRTGIVISSGIEGFIVVWVIGYAVSGLVRLMPHLPVGPRHVSVALVGSLGAVLMLVIHWIRQDIEAKIKKHFHLADALAPFFGRKLDSAFRVVRGAVRAS